MDTVLTISIVFIMTSMPIIATVASNRKHNKKNRDGGLLKYKQAKRVGRVARKV